MHKPRVKVDLFEHAEKISETSAKSIKSSKDVFLAEAKFPELFADFSVLYSGVGVLVALIELDALHQFLLNFETILVPNRVSSAHRDVAFARSDHL